jgi:cytosine permease
MNNQATQPAGQLPGYITSAVPNPKSNRAPWYKNTAPTYAGIFLWFAFWDPISRNGLSPGTLGATLMGIVIGALICHFLFFLVPGRLGMQTGLPLYIVGASTFGAMGSLIMPGLLMGVLQFGWLGVNTFYSSTALAAGFKMPGLFVPICIIFALGAAFVGLKGIQYVAKVSTYLPIIPLVVLVMGLVFYGGSAGDYKAAPAAADAASGSGVNAMLLMISAIVGFFATAGAAGVDICMSNRNKSDVSMGGIVGIIIAIVFTAGVSCIVMAGAHATGAVDSSAFQMTAALEKKLSPGLFATVMIGLTLAAFPGACFSSFIAANSFRTTMPKVNPFISVGIGAVVSIILAVTGVAGNLASVFGLIGASFGPICGAMMVDYLLSGGKWTGPRAGFNPAGWIAWVLGFIVGILPNPMIPDIVRPNVPFGLVTSFIGVDKSWSLLCVSCSPVAAFIVGAVVYLLCSKMGMRSAVVPLPAALAEATK